MGSVISIMRLKDHNTVCPDIVTEFEHVWPIDIYISTHWYINSDVLHLIDIFDVPYLLHVRLCISIGRKSAPQYLV